MSADAIEPAITKLVQEAPARDRATMTTLLADLRDIGSPLALVIARTLEYVDDDLVDPGIALPALAEACATLVSSRDPAVLAAAHYQIDTLEPQPPRVTDTSSDALAAVDVPVTNLVPRRRT